MLDYLPEVLGQIIGHLSSFEKIRFALTCRELYAHILEREGKEKLCQIWTNRTPKETQSRCTLDLSIHLSDSTLSGCRLFAYDLLEEGGKEYQMCCERMIIAWETRLSVLPSAKACYGCHLVPKSYKGMCFCDCATCDFNTSWTARHDLTLLRHGKLIVRRDKVLTREHAKHQKRGRKMYASGGVEKPSTVIGRLKDRMHKLSRRLKSLLPWTRGTSAVNDL